MLVSGRAPESRPPEKEITVQSSSHSFAGATLVSGQVGLFFCAMRFMRLQSKTNSHQNDIG